MPKPVIGFGFRPRHASRKERVVCIFDILLNRPNVANKIQCSASVEKLCVIQWLNFIYESFRLQHKVKFVPTIFCRKNCMF